MAKPSNSWSGVSETVMGAALLCGLILFVVIGMLTVLGPQVGNVFSKVTNNIANGHSTGSSPSGSGSTGRSGSTSGSGSSAQVTRVVQATPENVQVVPYGTEVEEVEAAPAAAERMIIREATITIEVEDPRASRETIEGMVAEVAHQGAFVVSSQEQGGSDTQLPTVMMSIRVPPSAFDQVMDRLATMSIKVHARSESAQDVTEEYFDLQGRVEAMEAGHRRLFGFMETTTSIDNLLQVEKQVSEREQEIGALRGRMEYLSQSAQLSKIDITLQPPVPAPAPEKPVRAAAKPDPGWHLLRTARSALDDLLVGVGALLNVMIYFSIAILPWLLGLGALVFGGWRGAQVIDRLLHSERKRQEE